MSGDTRRPSRIVVVDDNRFTRELAREALGDRRRASSAARAPRRRSRRSAREPADLVVSDLTMPGLSGLELLERVRREQPGTDFVLLTANASIESAVAALRMGASRLSREADPARGARAGGASASSRAAPLLDENARLRDALHDGRGVPHAGALSRPGRDLRRRARSAAARAWAARAAWRSSAARRSRCPTASPSAASTRRRRAACGACSAERKPIEPGSLGELEVRRAAAR